MNVKKLLMSVVAPLHGLGGWGNVVKPCQMDM
jgi:hypothetical protein